MPLAKWYSPNALTQLGLAVLGGTAIILVAQENRWGFVVGLASQPFWFITAIKNRQWGVFFLSLLYLGSWVYGVNEKFFNPPPIERSEPCKQNVSE